MLLTVCLLFLPSAARAVDIVSELTLSLSTDKACYAPGSTVTFTADGDLPSGKEVYVRYRHNNTFIEKHTITSKTWTWTPPKTDYMGYMVDLYYMEWNGDIGTEHIIGAIAVDVSSDWKRFPRYGFVAEFDNQGGSIDKDIEKEMKYLNRLHINGVQFYDWHWKHHKPVKFRKDGSLDPWYKDVSGRYIGTEFVKKYIEVQHRYGMKSIFYNLCFGALKDYEADGVKKEWGLYKEDSKGELHQDIHELPGWDSNIYLMNPGNPGWQTYLANCNAEVYANYDFDGYQIDQLGARDYKLGNQDGKLYAYNKDNIDLPYNYGLFIDAMKRHHPGKRLIMNAVGSYGSKDIAGKDVDFCYNETWKEQADFSDLFDIIKDNDSYSDHRLQTVFASYINYDKAGNYWKYDDKNVNTPGALLTDAVMFAIGGSHLEMGDHMLTREYFPAKPLAMTDDLKQRLIHYYDFMTAYQNILRGIDSKAAFTPTISSSYPINAWPPQGRKITAFAKKVDNMIAVHLLNFLNTDDLSWRDLEGTRPAPEIKENVQITYTTSRKITKVWTATPDKNGGVPMELPFTQDDNDVSVTVPSLEYWTMLVFEGTKEEENMYIIGDATQAKWDLANAKEMTRSTDGRTFSMKVHLEAGEDPVTREKKTFKFVNGKDYETNYCYNAEFKNYEFNGDINSGNLIFRKNTSTAPLDYKFTVNETGDYYITLDLNNMRIYVNKAGAATYDKLYVIGSATQAEWDLTKAIPLTKSASGFEYSGNCVITSDGTKEFKFMTDNTANNWGQDQFVKVATDNNIDIVKYDGKPEHEYKWKFTKEQSGNYKITVNLNTMRVTFTKLESKVYLCDGAFGTGDWESYTTEMNHKMADDVFTYTFTTDNSTGNKYIRFKIDNGEFNDIYAPSGDGNVELKAREFKTVPVDNTTTPNPSTGNDGKSWWFPFKQNTTYTIMVKNVNVGGYYHDKGLAIAYFEEPAYDKAKDGNPQLVVPGNALDGKQFVQCGGAYWYLDVDLSSNSGDFNFKFYSPEDKEYIGAYNHEMNTINDLSFTQFYWGNNELGPNDNNYYGRNLLYTLPAAKATGKVRINLWKVGKDSKTGETIWKFYVANNENHDDITYYMVLNGKRYAMSPTRERIGGRNVLRTVWSLNLQDFQLKGINNGEFGYHIESSDGKKYSCHSINPDYRLGLNGLADYYPNSTSPVEGDKFEGNYSNDAGNVARYERYDDMQVNGEAEFEFSAAKMNSYNGKSVTWIFNPGRGYTLTALINKSNFGGTEAATGYSIVGNLNADDKDSSDPFSMHMQLPEYQRNLTKYWYKGGRLYNTEQAAPDSIVYRVTVNRPVNGWKTDGYTIVVFDNETLKKAATSTNVTALWENAIRPQEEWLHPYSGQKDYTGVNATALKGGLYTRRTEQKDDVQQMISFKPTGESFTFSLNTTTSTYFITDNKRLYILGPAVGTTDNDRESAGWSTADAENQTSHAYPLVYDSSLGCYCYKGADGNGDEQPVPMAANSGFAFAWGKSFANLSFCEDNNVPRALINDQGNSTEATEYQSTTGSNGHNETQYVNWLQPCRNLSDTYNASVVKACNFGLPTQKGTGYYIRLYVSPNPSADDTAMPTEAFYTIRRTYTFSTPIDPKNPVGEYKTFKTFSDYYAVVLPDGVDALYVDSADKQNRTVTLKTYTLQKTIDEKRVLPAGAAVILATKNGATSGASGEIVKTDMSFDYHSDPTFAEANYGSKPDYNMLKSQITREKLPYAASDGYNYLFSFQKHLDSDQKNTIGFFRAGAANNPVNTAYLQIDKGFNDAAAKGWSLSFDFNDATGIRQPEIVDGGGDCYTLQGIRVKKPAAKGIYIVNGKKVIR